MATQNILTIHKSVLISTCIALSMFLVSCNSAPSKIVPGEVESIIYTKDVTANRLKKRIVVGENGGYWEYNEEIKETGCNIDAKLEVSDDYCLDEWSCEEVQFPDTKPATPYKCICTVGWTYHSLEGDASPAMNWSILFVADGDVTVGGNRHARFGGKAHGTAEALSSARLICDNVVLKSEWLSEKVEGSWFPSIQLNSFIVNTQPRGVLPAGSTSIELRAELSASVKAEAKAQAGFLSFLSPARSCATSHASVEIAKLGFVNFYRVEEKQRRLATRK